MNYPQNQGYPQPPNQGIDTSKILGWIILTGAVLVVLVSVFLPREERETVTQNPTPAVTPPQQQDTSREFLAYMRVTSPHVGETAAYSWAVDAVDACIEGEQAPPTAVASASCLAGRAEQAHQRAAVIRGAQPPLDLVPTHLELVRIVDVEEQAVSRLATGLAAVAAQVDRKRGRTRWALAWGGEGPEISELEPLRRIIDGELMEQARVWVQQMNRACDQKLRCANREFGGRQIRCLWRTVVDSFGGEPSVVEVRAAAESPLPACDGTRVPCHDPPGGWPR